MKVSNIAITSISQVEIEMAIFTCTCCLFSFGETSFPDNFKRNFTHIISPSNQSLCVPTIYWWHKNFLRIGVLRAVSNHQVVHIILKNRSKRVLYRVHKNQQCILGNCYSACDYVVSVTEKCMLEVVQIFYHVTRLHVYLTQDM